MKSLTTVLRMPDGVAKTAALVAWVQGLFAAGSEPVLVGGAAVELYTLGAYTTGDLDLVGSVPSDVCSALLSTGFRRHGRHFLHEEGQVFLEFPSTSLHEGEDRTRLDVGGSAVVVITAEDLIAERLAAWRHWRSMIDGVNAWLVFRARRASLDRRRLRRQAQRRDAGDALRALLAFTRRAQRREPTPEEVELWALRGQ